MANGKRKVAILGGGHAALTAALQLSDPRNEEAKNLELTIYQLGWRLGGKGATGRSDDGTARVLEHGLHNWFGFYENTFRQARDVYDEYTPPAGSPLQTFDDAFLPADSGMQVEWIEGKALLWEVAKARRPGKPGIGGLSLTRARAVAPAIKLVKRNVADSVVSAKSAKDDKTLARFDELLHKGPRPARADPRPLTVLDVLDYAADFANADARGAKDRRVERFLDALQELETTPGITFALPDRFGGIERAIRRAVCGALALAMRVLWNLLKEDIGTAAHSDNRRRWVQANFAYSCVTGALVDGVVDDGFDVINQHDFRAWLMKHDFKDGDLMIKSPIVEAVYCGSFAYPEGDTSGPLPFPPAGQMEAGAALRGVVRTLLTYKGAFAYRFAAGTADTFYAPAYEVLRARGVRFRFFSDVRKLELEDGRIARIRIARQAAVKGGGEYDPLIDVAGLKCWPAQPRWQQLDLLPGEHPDFEWPTAEIAPGSEEVLEYDTDFDAVVLGISIGALPGICDEIVRHYDAWATAIDRVKTVRTQALQLWLTHTPKALGLESRHQPVANWRYGGLSPLGVWGDFKEVIDVETWPEERKPAGLSYLCSTMPHTPEFTSQREADAQVLMNARELLRRGLRVILPKIVDGQGNPRWGRIVDPTDATGAEPDRLATQWYRANVTPTEQYVLSLVGSSEHRLPVHDPDGPSNLYLAGDWTQCQLNSGCMEAATISGMLCSEALSKYPGLEDIAGMNF